MCRDASMYRQRGATLLIALAVIVLFALLAAALARLQQDSGKQTVVEVQAVRAWLAAQTGLERQLQVLYPVGTWSRSVCLTLDSSTSSSATSTTLSLTGSGQDGCQVTVQCQALTAQSPAVTTLQLTSQGRCAPADSRVDAGFTVTRTLQAEVFNGVGQ